MSRPSTVCLLLVVVTLAVYGQVAWCGFASYDDNEYVRENGWVQTGLTWDSVWWALTTNHAANWHPLTWLSLMLDREWFGASPAGSHLVNLLFHAANSALLFLLLRQATGAHWRSAAVAGLFALHSLHVESVAWIAERKDVLSAFLGLLALLFFVRHAQQQNARSEENPAGEKRTVSLPSAAYLWSLLFFALGLLSKPMLVTWPFVLLLLDWWPLERISPFGFHVSGSSTRKFSQLVREKIPFFALSLLSCVVTFIVQRKDGAMGTFTGFPVTARIENAFVSYARYLAKTIWPFDLAVIYPHPEHWPWPTVTLSACLILGLSALMLWHGRKWPFLVVGWFWFLGTLVPVIGLVQVGMQAMADRYTYLPLIGVFILFAWGVSEITARWQTTRSARIIIGVMTSLVLVACAARTADQLRHWRNGETLARHALAVTKANYVAYGILGTYLSDNGRLADAIENYRRAVQIRPADVQAQNNLGLALAHTGRLSEAADCFRLALRINPHFADAHNNLGNVLSAQGREEEALNCFRRALQSNPDYAEALNNLGRISAHRGQNDEAIASYRRALQIKPNLADGFFNLGNARARQGQFAEAAENYRRALRIHPDDAEAHRNLGWTLSQLGRRDEAIAHLTEALRLKPDDAGTKQQLHALGVKD